MSEEKTYILEKVPFPHCPYCDYWALGGVPGEAKINMKQHIQQKHPEKQSRLNRLIARIKMADDFWWELPQWFCPVWCELPSWRFWITSITTSIATFWLTKSILITTGWLLGFQIFGWILASILGVFDND